MTVRSCNCLSCLPAGISHRFSTCLPGKSTAFSRLRPVLSVLSACGDLSNIAYPIALSIALLWRRYSAVSRLRPVTVLSVLSACGDLSNIAHPIALSIALLWRRYSAISRLKPVTVCPVCLRGFLVIFRPVCLGN